MILSTDYR